MGARSSRPAADTRYVDDDRVLRRAMPRAITTIQAAVNASDGGGDTIIVYPGAYAAFNMPAGANYDYLTVKGVTADAVFIDGSINSAVDAISIAADGVHIANLTMRNATNGVNLKDGAGEATLAGGQETSIDHLLAYNMADYPVNISQSAALKLTDSTLVGNGVDPILKVGYDSEPGGPYLAQRHSDDNTHRLERGHRRHPGQPVCHAGRHGPDRLQINPSDGRDHRVLVARFPGAARNALDRGKYQAQ